MSLIHILNNYHDPFPHLIGRGGLHFHPSRRIIGGMLGRGDRDIVPISKGALSLPKQQASEQAEEDEDIQLIQEETSSQQASEPDVIQDIVFKQNGDLYSLRDPRNNNLANACKIRGLSSEGTRRELWERMDKFIKKLVEKHVEKPKEKIKKKDEEKEAKELVKAKANEKKVLDNLEENINVIKTKLKREKAEMNANLMSTSELKDIENLKKSVESRLETAFKSLPDIVAKSNKLLDLIKKLEDIHAQKEENMNLSDDDDEDNDESITKFVLDGYEPKLKELETKAINDQKFEKIDILNLQQVKDYLNEAKSITLIKGYEFPKYLNALETLLNQIDNINEILKNNKKNKIKNEEDKKLKEIESKSKQVQENAERLKKEAVILENLRLAKEAKRAKQQAIENEKQRLVGIIDAFEKRFAKASDKDDKYETRLANAKDELQRTGKLDKYEGILQEYTLMKDTEKAEAEAEAEAKAEADAKAEAESKKISSKVDMNFIKNFIAHFNSKKTRNTKVKAYYDFYDSKDHPEGPNAETLKALVLKRDELLDKFDKEQAIKNKNKAPTNAQVKKSISDIGLPQGMSFEVYMTNYENGRKIIRLITGSDSEATLTNNSPRIANGIICDNGRSLKDNCVIDGSNGDACLEFKARMNIKFLELKDTATIGLTTTKLGSNLSFNLMFDKVGSKWKVKNVFIDDDRNIIDGKLIKTLFDDNILRDYFAIYKFEDCIAYYDILDDMTDDIKVFNDGKKNIFVGKIGTHYQFVKYKFKAQKGVFDTNEFPIPKTKFKIITK